MLLPSWSAILSEVTDYSEDTRIRSSAQSAFVGREHELAETFSGLEDARGGRGRFFLVTGEPGIGKTRLADQVAMHAAQCAMTVLRAGCWEGGGAPAYWPFIQLIRSALSVSDPDVSLKVL